MSRARVLETILERKIVAVVRSPDGGKLVEVAKALAAGGVAVMEITFTVPNALDVLKAVRSSMGDSVTLGAGTVLDPETARAAILAGAEFVVAPNTNAKVIKLCRRYSTPVMPGAYTPTEILKAWELGADVVKVFPADIGGPAYLRAVSAPLPQVRLMPTGGVDLTTAADFLKAGACCLGVGSCLVEKTALAAGDMNRITSLARSFVEVVGKG
jgi:2-dehydro-3-deoxyphosphogluconate aldolase / (4S)-4-hydroxy-2-oxoglutarate aldolase